MMRQAAVRMNGRFTSMETGVRSYSAGNEDMEGVDADDMKRTSFDVAKVLFCGDNSRADRHTQGTRRHTAGIYIKSETNLSSLLWPPGPFSTHVLLSGRVKYVRTEVDRLQRSSLTQHSRPCDYRNFVMDGALLVP